MITPLSHFQSNFTGMLLRWITTKIAKMVLLQWTRRLPELKADKNKMTTYLVSLSLFQSNFTGILPRCRSTKIVETVLLQWTRLLWELKTDKHFKWQLLPYHWANLIKPQERCQGVFLLKKLNRFCSNKQEGHQSKKKKKKKKKLFTLQVLLNTWANNQSNFARILLTQTAQECC